MQPIIKWAGSKRYLASTIVSLTPTFSRYVEPFLGAGAILFSLTPSKALVGDVNPELINLYEVIKKYPATLLHRLKNFKLKCPETYYDVRSWDRNSDWEYRDEIDKAARFIYLNKSCYNGLYRVNKNGYFNTPFGNNSTTNLVNESNFNSISNYLQSIELYLGDYSKLLEKVESTDFVYLDPPYYGTFSSYTSNSFNHDDHIRLKTWVDKLSSMGTKVLVSNSNCKEVREMYKEYNIIDLTTPNMINCNPSLRSKKELLIANYEISRE